MSGPSDLTKLLFKLEKIEHSWFLNGNRWDKPGRLFVLYDNQDRVTTQRYARLREAVGVGPIRLGRFSAQLACPVETTANHFASKIKKLAQLMVDPDLHQSAAWGSLILWSAPGFRGLIAMNEAWAVSPVTPEEQQRERERMQRGIALSDLPYKQECRLLSAVDVDNQSTSIWRMKGQSPEEMPVQMVGAVPDSLRTIVSFILGQDLPPNPELDFGREYQKYLLSNEPFMTMTEFALARGYQLNEPDGVGLFDPEEARGEAQDEDRG